MSHRATNWAFEQRGLPPVQSLVLIRLADHHNNEHGCFPSQALLAEEVNVSPSTLNEHLRALEERRLIRRVRRRDTRTRRQLATRYILAFEERPEADGADPTPKSGVGSDDGLRDAEGAADRAPEAHAEGEPSAAEDGADSGQPDTGRLRPAGHGPTPDSGPSRLRNSGKADSGWPESKNQEVNLELNPQARERARAGGPACAAGGSTSAGGAPEAGVGFSEEDWLDLLDALRIDPEDPPEYWARRAARAHVRGWLERHGLTFAEVLEVARASVRQHGGAPDGPKGLDRAVRRAAKARPPSPEEQAAKRRVTLERTAEWIRGGRLVHLVSEREAAEVIEAGLISREEARRAGVVR
jgi:DNA-binding transcriptional ArsR family regulator